MQAAFYEHYKQDLELLICEDNEEAKKLEDVASFLKLKSFVLPDFRAVKGDDLRSFSAELIELCKVLAAYHQENEQKLLISPFSTILHKLPSKENLKSLKIEKNQDFDIKELVKQLENAGYEQVDIVQEAREFCLRADILDLFAINHEQPLRILFFESECESIRHFDIFSQKSVAKELDFVEIVPFLANLSQKQSQDLKQDLKNLLNDNIINDYNSSALWYLKELKNYLDLNYLCIKELKSFDHDLSELNKHIISPAKKYKEININYNKDIFSFHKDKKITVIATNEALTQELDFDFTYIKSDICLNLLSEDELIISLNKNIRKKKKKKARLLIDELKKDDFVVHEDYGIAKFMGLETIKAAGVYKDFVSLLYQNNDKLLLPVENLYLIDKYIGLNASIPTLDRLGKNTFIKMKERLKERLFIIASNIIALAAKRELIQAKDIRYDPLLMQSFVVKAGFNYTADQISICKEIMKDFQSKKVMDRLISGDVGFGKTEIATYAALACLKSGFNVLFFVPTTLLSSQHYKNIKERLKDFKLDIYRLDRFTSSKDKKRLKLALEEEKKAKLIIGTHALLSIKCENLALVIIDEEHKFGVKQKEKLKELSKKAHILSMSATPIPRSLNQALSSIKSYSLLQTPPKDRLDIRTIFKEYSQSLVKEAILRELRKGGQVFFLHNHIASIKNVEKELLALLPKLKILVLHSKIDSKESEEAMLSFENKEYDLMLCTSIVESGLDLPNANTMIVNNADKFGMADLHQLRGRVGRSKSQGFCYLLIKNKNELSKQALKRLLALESNSFLGAGQILAYHDLEIRGGGNLLGIDQSGHLEQIGYSLYLKMLEDELNKLSQKELFKEDEKIDIRLRVNAFLSPELISEDRLRLELYRRLSKCEKSIALIELEAEIIDRFGKIDRYSKQFIDIIMIKILAKDKYKLISNWEENIYFTSLNDEKIHIKASSKDEDDIINACLLFLRKADDKRI